MEVSLARPRRQYATPKGHLRPEVPHIDPPPREALALVLTSRRPPVASLLTTTRPLVVIARTVPAFADRPRPTVRRILDSMNPR